MNQLSVEYVSVPLGDLRYFPRNSREGDVGAIIESIRENGVYRPLSVSKRTMHVLDGNHTLKAMRELGYEAVDIGLVTNDDGSPLTDEQELRIVLAANRTADLASYNDHALVETLADLHKTERGLAGTGFDGDDLDAMLGDLFPEKAYDKDDQGRYTRKVESPIYEPSDGDPPALEDLYDTTKRDELLKAIAKSKLPDPIVEMLTVAAYRHVKFEYDKVADYYSHAPKDVQRLMEESALVIIDYDRAIELGFLHVNDEMEAAFDDDYPGQAP